MPKRYNTPHRSRVVKTRLSEDEYAGLHSAACALWYQPVRISPAGDTRTAIRPVIHVSAVNDELLSAVGETHSRVRQ